MDWSTEIYYLTPLRIEFFSSKDYEGETLPCLSLGFLVVCWQCLALFGLWQQFSSPHDILCLSVSMPKFTLCGWTQTYWISVHPNEFILTSSPAKLLFQNKATVMGTGHEDSKYFRESLFSLKYYSWMTDVWHGTCRSSKGNGSWMLWKLDRCPGLKSNGGELFRPTCVAQVKD